MNIEERLTKLEKQNKKLRYVNTISLVLIGMFLITGFQQQFQLPDIIKAKGFILLDDNGKERAVLKIDKTEKRNSPKLRFYNENNDIITSIGTNENSGYLSMYKIIKNEFSDSFDTSSIWLDGGYFNQKYNSENKLYIGLSSEDKPLIKLYDLNYDKDDTTVNIIGARYNNIKVNSEDRFFAGLSLYGVSVINSTYLSLNDIKSMKLSQSNTRLRFNQFPEFIMGFKNEDVKLKGYTYNRLRMGVNEDGNYYNYIYDKFEKLRFSQYIFNYNEYPKISTNYYDQNELLRLTIGNKELRSSEGYEFITPESSLNLFDENGNVIEQLPR